MELKGKKIGFVLTGSFCTFKKTIEKIKELVKLEAKIIPIMSFNSYNTDTKFGKAKDFIDEIEQITDNKIIHKRRTIKINVVVFRSLAYWKYFSTIL